VVWKCVRFSVSHTRAVR